MSVFFILPPLDFFMICCVFVKPNVCVGFLCKQNENAVPGSQKKSFIKLVYPYVCCWDL